MIPKGIKSIFFDLDRTLWDFEKNSTDTLRTLLDTHQIEVCHEQFIYVYQHFNQLYWDLYQRGKLKQEVLRKIRFNATLSYFSIKHTNLDAQLSEDYLSICPKKTAVFPNTLEVLKALKEKHSIYLVTNGFCEVQKIKIQHSGIAPFIDGMITSDDVGVKKPHPKIFKYAMQQASITKANEVLFIGDDLHADMMGADYLGMHTLHFTAHKNGAWAKQFSQLSELLEK